MKISETGPTVAESRTGTNNIAAIAARKILGMSSYPKQKVGDSSTSYEIGDRTDD